MTYPNGNGKTESLLPRRVITINIETVSLDPQDPDGAKDARTGRIACIGMLIDDAVTLAPLMIADQDERKILERFWTSITENDLLVGHSILGFDLLFIRQRSWIVGVKPPVVVNLRKYYTDQVLDLMEMWTNWGYRFKGCGLENIAQALGIEGAKTGHGSQTTEMWYSGQFGKLLDYCMNDVWLAYQVYCRMHYRNPLPLQLPGIALPAFLPGDTREKVSIQQKGAEALQTLQPPALVAAFPTPSVPQASAQDEKREMFFETLSTGRVRIFGPGFFLPGFKDTLKKIYQLKGHKLSGPNEKPQRWEWTMDQSNLQSLSELCVARGIQFLRAGNGTLSLPRGA